MISWTNNKQPEVQPEVVAPGYVYFRDNGMDYKIGITKNMIQRGAAYKTENPRDTVLDFIEVQDMEAARFIESKLKDEARDRKLLSFQNSGEWLKRVPESVELWKEISTRSARRSEAEWLELVDSLNVKLARLNGQYEFLQNKLSDREKERVRWRTENEKHHKEAMLWEQRNFKKNGIIDELIAFAVKGMSDKEDRDSLYSFKRMLLDESRKDFEKQLRLE